MKKEFVVIFVAFLTILVDGRTRALDMEPTEEKEEPEEKAAELIKKPAHYDKIVKSAKDDEVIGTEFIEKVESEDTKGRGATNNNEKKWKNYKMVIIIEPEFSEEARETIQSAIYTLFEAMNECFQFMVLPPGQTVSARKDHLIIRREGNGCYSSLGRKQGQQVTNLGEGCNLYGTTMHEIMHVLGFYHEHVRPDRDQYVQVEWDTLTTDTERGQYNVRKDQVTFTGEYDFDSVMHYPLSKSLTAKSGKKPSGVRPGQRNHLSKRDVQRLRGMYPCDKKP